MYFFKKDFFALALFPALYAPDQSLSEDLQELVRNLEEQKNHNFEAAKLGAVRLQQKQESEKKD